MAERLRTTVYTGTRNGKKMYKTVCASSKSELNRKVAELRQQINDGKDIMTKAYFGQWASKWFNEVVSVKNIGQTTKTQHDINIRILNCYFENVELKKITLSDFQVFINEVSKESPLSHKPLSKESLHKIVMTAQCIFKYARGSNVIAPDFDTKQIIVPDYASVTKRRALTEEEQTMIIETPHRAQLPAMIMLFSGLRRGELCALTWNDINLNDCYINVNKSLDLRTGKLKEGGKTVNANRVVPIPPILVDYLRNYKQTHKTVSLYVCTDTNGCLFKDKNFRNMWESYLLDLNIKYAYAGKNVSKFGPNNVPFKIERFTPHYLRHTFATILYLQGVDTVSAKQYLGHADVQTTIDIYTDLENNNRVTLSDSYKQRLQSDYKIMYA